MDIPRWAWWIVTGVAVLGYALLWFVGDELDTWMLQVGVVGFGYPFLVGTSGKVWGLVDGVLDADDAGDDGTGGEELADGGELQGARADDDGTSTGGDGDQANDPEQDVGFLVGKCENVLILTFMVVGAYTALAVIFAAKSIVRGEDMKDNSRYYLAGTMTNVTYSVAVGVGVRVLLRWFDAWPIAFLGTP